MDEQNMERPRRVRRTDRYKEEPEEIVRRTALIMNGTMQEALLRMERSQGRI